MVSNTTDDKEKNKTIYLSSAYWKDHWSYQKCVDILKACAQGRRDFVCGLPYQLSIKEGLLDPELIESEMLDSQFNEVKQAMEYESIFWGSAEDAFFDFNSVNKNRRIKYPMLPNRLACKLKGDKNIAIQTRLPGEKRILSADIALMASTKHNNDATSIHITQLLPTKAGRYTVNLIYTEVNEGLRTEEEALVIRRLFDEFSCDYIALDAKSFGLSIYDALAMDIDDPETGELYPALSCCNNADMAARCRNRDAQKVIWAILGNAKFNSDCALMLRDGFRSGRIRMLDNEYDGEVSLGDIPGFSKLDAQDKAVLLLPYINTTLLVNELVNLKHEETGGLVRISEKSGMRKDRYSSLSYNYYVATQLEKKLKEQSVTESVSSNRFVFRAPKIK